MSLEEQEEIASKKLTENLKQRGFIVKEIIATERVYVDKLKAMIEVYIEPIRVKEILDSCDINSQFLNLEVIHGLHVKLLSDLTIEKVESDVKVGLVFSTFAPFLKMYTQYVMNFELAMTRRAQLLISNKKLSTFLDSAKADPRSKGGDLESFLVGPVQRIPRYRMLLEQVLKYTPPDHEDYPNLVSSLEKVSEVATHNNEAIRQREKKERILVMMMTIEPKTRVNLLDEPNRTFVREGDLLRQCRRGTKYFRFWLFNDKLLYGEANGFGMWTLNRQIDLTQCRVVEVLAGIENVDTAFQIESPTKSFIIWAETPVEKNEWVELINQQMVALRELYVTNTGRIAPVWKPDASSSKCSLCATPFSVFFRKHHCRLCGEVVCDPCSNTRRLITDLHDAPVRVCNKCKNSRPCEEDSSAPPQSPAESQKGNSFMKAIRRGSALLMGTTVDKSTEEESSPIGGSSTKGPKKILKRSSIDEETRTSLLNRPSSARSDIDSSEWSSSNINESFNGSDVSHLSSRDEYQELSARVFAEAETGIDENDSISVDITAISLRETSIAHLPLPPSPPTLPPTPPPIIAGNVTQKSSSPAPSDLEDTERERASGEGSIYTPTTFKPFQNSAPFQSINNIETDQFSATNAQHVTVCEEVTHIQEETEKSAVADSPGSASENRRSGTIKDNPIKALLRRKKANDIS